MATVLRWAIGLTGALALAGAGLIAEAFMQARARPVVRHLDLALPGWPAGAAPVSVALISDIHIGSPAMDETRLRGIVAQINALGPDLVLIAGDSIYGHAPESAARLGAPLAHVLAELRAPLGTVAALGNHDHWTGAEAVRKQYAAAGVILLDNEAIVRGPLALGVAGDDFTRRDDVPATLAAVRRLPGARVLLTHSPDIAPDLPPDMPLLLAGHTHCGQVVLPIHGAIVSVSRHGERYRCGAVREGGRTVVVTAGLGTSGPPLRLGAPPDIWLIRLHP